MITPRPHESAPHGVAHHRRGVARRFVDMRRRGATAIAAFLLVLGPGLLAGVSDDDPAGITTYSVLGADFGYTLLWIIPLSTVLLILFHLLAVRVGAATGVGFAGALRRRYGPRVGIAAAVGLVIANIGTICAEYAGVAAASALVDVPPWVSGPTVGAAVIALVIRGSFHRVERVLLVVSSSLAMYVGAALVAHPDWSAVVRGSVVPTPPSTGAGWVVIAAALGTTLAPWGLAFIQSYAVDKRITVESLRWERIDVVGGSVLTGVIGLSVAVACAATLHQTGTHVTDAGDAAIALRPLVGSLATLLFGVGLLGAAVLAAAIVPLATAYSIAEGFGVASSLDADARHDRVFYGSFVALTVVAVVVVSIPGISLIPLIYLSQVANAVLLPLHMVALIVLARDPGLMGAAVPARWMRALCWIAVVIVVACVGALAASPWLGS